MIALIILAILNIIVSSIGRYGIGLPGFDLTLIGVIILARSGENILLSAIVLTIAFMLPSPGRFRYFIQQVLFVWVAGFIAVSLDMVYLPIFVFHILGMLWVMMIGLFNGRHVMNMFINIGLSIFVARFYVLMS